MKPNDYARIASAATALAEETRPKPADQTHADGRNLMVYHLRAAAAIGKKIAEDEPKP